MGLFSPRNKPPIKSGDNWTVIKGGKKKQAKHKEELANAKECKKRWCSNSAGGHRFKQEGAQDYCAKHAHPDNR